MHKLTEEYKSQISKYDDFRLKAEILIRELLIQNSINFHKIESRVKDENRLEEKISRKHEKYKSLGDITDLIGIRIITYFEDEVDKIAKIIEKEFKLDKTKSIDKRKGESDKFGYKSLHYIVSLIHSREKLTEYQRFKGILFEIQIRSILQHAWAEIEHDLGYKGEIAIPDALKRNFYRVSALLETADIEFVNIKDKLINYKSTIEESIKNNPEDVELNSDSLKKFVETSEVVNKLDNEIATRTNSELIKDFDFGAYEHLEKLHFLEIKTIKSLETFLIENSDKIVNFAEIYLNEVKGHGSIPLGISIFYLCYVLVGKKDNINLANHYVNNFIYTYTKLDEDDKSGKQIIDTYKKIVKQKKN